VVDGSAWRSAPPVPGGSECLGQRYPLAHCPVLHHKLASGLLLVTLLRPTDVETALLQPPWRHVLRCHKAALITCSISNHTLSRCLEFTFLTYWRPLLPYGYSYKVSCASVPDWVKQSFVIFGIRALVTCPDVKNYKGRLNPVWNRMLYSCTHMTTVGVKGLSLTYTSRFVWAVKSNVIWYANDTMLMMMTCSKVAVWRHVAEPREIVQNSTVSVVVIVVICNNDRVKGIVTSASYADDK